MHNYYNQSRITAQIFILQITILSKTSGALRHNLGLWIIILICNGIKYIFCAFFTWISHSRDIVGNTTTLCNLFISILKIGFNFPNPFCLKNKRKWTISKSNHLHLQKNTKQIRMNKHSSVQSDALYLLRLAGMAELNSVPSWKYWLP